MDERTAMREAGIAAGAKWLADHEWVLGIRGPMRFETIAEGIIEASVEAIYSTPSGTQPSLQPDLSDPGQALAHRVQRALEREFDGEPLFPCVVVVEENMTRRVGVAATAVGLENVDRLLMLGRGTVRRTLREHRP